ncbi:MAG: FAD-dependent oxidoreductase [Rhodospirillales bacterium]
MTITVAIIGSGPAGFYTADALVNADCDVQVDIIERLPTPYGLIRGGVAPDHQTTKKVAKKYEQTALFDDVRYFGNVEVNKDVSLAELRDMYDAVVLAVGAPGDRKLTIPGADKKGVHGSAAFVGWYNGHPDFRELEPDLNTPAAVVIGNGNVALDCARVLVRSRQGMAGADIAAHAMDAIEASSITDVYLTGRRGPLDAKFTNVELRELGELNQSVPLARAEQLPDAVPDDMEARAKRLAERNLANLRDYATNDPEAKPKRIHIEFFAQPVAILGDDRAEAVSFERTRVVDGRAEGTGELFEIPCGLVIAAIGYRSDPMEGAPFDEKAGIIPNRDGRVDDGLYAVGWIKRGPTGVISSNRPDGVTVAEYICDDFKDITEKGGGKPGRAALAPLLAERGVRIVTFEDWKRIEAAEVARAEGRDSPREKFVSVPEMLKVLDA